jgi:hypothetical protein
MHRHVVQRAGLEHAYPLSAMPENEALEGMAAGLAAAWTEVRRHRGTEQAVTCRSLAEAAVQPHLCPTQVGNADGVVIMVVQPGERNVFDQQWIQARAGLPSLFACAQPC